MPRNISGLYSLPAGNPVIGHETIESDWANTTMPDIAAALTDSLSRSGNGGMLVPFRFVDGTVGAPGITFANEPTSGIYRAALNDVRVSIGASDVLQFTPAGVTIPAGKTLAGSITGTAAITGGSINGTPIGNVTPSTGAFTALTSTSGALNGSLGATTPSTGAFTTLAASASVTAPLVTAPLVQSAGAVDLVLGANGGTDWNVAAAGKHWLPGVDNTQNIGSVAKRVAALFSPIHDSGAGSLLLKGAGVTALTLTGANGVFAGTLAVTGALTPAQVAGIVGTTTNNDAQAGSVGEYVTASLAQAGQLGLSTGAGKTIISVVLTAGDWDVDGVIHFNYGPTDAVLALFGGTSTVANTLGPIDTQAIRVYPSAGQVQANQQTHRLPVPTQRFSLAATTTVFLVAVASFTGGYAAHGMIRARRVR